MTHEKQRVLEYLREAETQLRAALASVRRRADSYEGRPDEETLSPACVGGNMAQDELEEAAKLAREAAATIDQALVLALVLEGGGS